MLHIHILCGTHNIVEATGFQRLEGWLTNIISWTVFVVVLVLFLTGISYSSLWGHCFLVGIEISVSVVLAQQSDDRFLFHVGFSHYPLVPTCMCCWFCSNRSSTDTIYAAFKVKFLLVIGTEHYLSLVYGIDMYISDKSSHKIMAARLCGVRDVSK